MIMREMVSLKSKYFLQDTELESWIHKIIISVETLIRVFLAADDCSKPMFLALS